MHVLLHLFCLWKSLLFIFLGIDFLIKNVNVYRRKIKLILWDTAGAERFNSITTAYFRGAAVGGRTDCNNVN